jgi:Domain of unknown function (DUF4260)
MITGGMRNLLRLEGLTYLIFAVAAFAAAKGSWIAFVVLFMVPDLSFVAYLAGQRTGSYCYNAMHSVIGPAMLALAGQFFSAPELWDFAAIWLAHVGFDRMLGYGLKYPSGFKDTHLGRIGT